MFFLRSINFSCISYMLAERAGTTKHYEMSFAGVPSTPLGSILSTCLRTWDAGKVAPRVGKPGKNAKKQAVIWVEGEANFFLEGAPKRKGTFRRGREYFERKLFLAFPSTEITFPTEYCFPSCRAVLSVS